ncbi:hypothetical protein K523DRAFT_47197 [Schizophyllum commune Tattone D]|nr:hypothetical protein K523DRAFT_47197 [Schizophyllum commune Tattone D]
MTLPSRTHVICSSPEASSKIDGKASHTHSFLGVHTASFASGRYFRSQRTRTPEVADPHPKQRIVCQARLAQSDRASDSYLHRRESEGCEFDPRGGLLVFPLRFLLRIQASPSSETTPSNCRHDRSFPATPLNQHEISSQSFTRRVCDDSVNTHLQALVSSSPKSSLQKTQE